MPCSLPSGRILYRGADEQPFVVLLHEPTRGLYLAHDGWTSDTLVAGPFDEYEMLRALRLANVRVPDGCELGPWQWGISFFERTGLRFPLDEWAAFDPSWLAPGMTFYSDADADGVVNEVCCGAPHDEPHVRWGESPGLPDELLRVLRRRHPGLELGAVGMLEREWNAHPVGSLVVRIHGDAASSNFLVVDLPY